MRIQLLIAAAVVASAHASAQIQSTVQSATDTGSYALYDTNPAVHSATATGTSVTVADPIKSLAEDRTPSPRAHARTKATLRLLPHVGGALPALRIYEAGFADVETTAIPREAGTATTTGTPAAHAFDLNLQGLAGRWLRLQVRLTSSIEGTGVTGGFRVDVGNDNSLEFDASLDGKRRVFDLPIELDNSGNLTIRIESEARVMTNALARSSYRATFDVNIEPIVEGRTTVEIYGQACGASMWAEARKQGVQAFTGTGLRNGPRNAPAFYLAGIGRTTIPFEGCFLQMSNIVAEALIFTGPTGEITHNYLPFFEKMNLDVLVQYLSIDNGQLVSTEGANFKSTPGRRQAFDFFEFNHILSTGQSLALGFGGGPALTTTQPYQNKMFRTGVCGNASSTLLPLVEQSVETHHSAMANLITKLAEDVVFKNNPSPNNTHEMVVSCHGMGGRPYIALQRGTANYRKGMAQVQAAKTWADNRSLPYIVRAVTNVHGEQDHDVNNTNYQQNLVTWQSDYENDVREITGQLHPVPMLHTQMSNWSKLGEDTSVIPQQQLDASINSPRKIVLVGPKYHLPYANDGLHLTNTSYRKMGEEYARVYQHTVLEGGTWEPLRPVQAKLSGTTIDVRFFVPAPPLVLDTTLVTNPGNFGFEFHDDSPTPATITAVELIDEDTVRLTLDQAPTGANPVVRYAFTSVGGVNAGPTTGPRGNLRDSDNPISLHGNALHNWAVHFEQPVVQ